MPQVTLPETGSSPASAHSSPAEATRSTRIPVLTHRKVSVAICSSSVCAAGTALPNGERSDMTSIPVQCTQENPACLGKKPRAPAAAAPGPASQCGIELLTRNTGAFSSLLAEDMDKLSVNMPHQIMTNGLLEHKATSVLSLDSSKWPAALSSGPAGQADYSGRDRTVCSWRVRGSLICLFPCDSSKRLVLSALVFVPDAFDRQCSAGGQL